MDMLIVQIGNVIGSRVNTFIGNLSGQDVSSGIESVLSGGNLLLTFLIVVIIGPVMEELIFRKVLIDRTIVFGDWTAILLSGMIFGLAHGSFEQLFYAFGSGCLYAYIYIKTGKVRYTISLHMVTNFLTGFLLILISPDTTDLTRLVNGNDSINSGVFPGYVLYMIVVLVLSFIGLILFIRAVRKKKVKMVPGKYSMPAGRTAKAVFGNVGIILFLIIVAFMFVIKIVA